VPTSLKTGQKLLFRRVWLALDLVQMSRTTRIQAFQQAVLVPPVEKGVPLSHLCKELLCFQRFGPRVLG
jgi:hypothetical protein